MVVYEADSADSFATTFHTSLSVGSSTLEGGNNEKDICMVTLEGTASVATSLRPLEVTPTVIRRAH